MEYLTVKTNNKEFFEVVEEILEKISNIMIDGKVEPNMYVEDESFDYEYGSIRGTNSCMHLIIEGNENGKEYLYVTLSDTREYAIKLCEELCENQEVISSFCFGEYDDFEQDAHVHITPNLEFFQKYDNKIHYIRLDLEWYSSE